MYMYIYIYICRDLLNECMYGCTHCLVKFTGYMPCVHQYHDVQSVSWARSIDIILYML